LMESRRQRCPLPPLMESRQQGWIIPAPIVGVMPLGRRLSNPLDLAQLQIQLAYGAAGSDSINAALQAQNLKNDG
jgi:hypothetical protein